MMKQASIILFGVLATLNLYACHYPVSKHGYGGGCNGGCGFSGRGLYDNYRSCGNGIGGYGGYGGHGGYGGYGGYGGPYRGFGGFGGVVGAGGFGGVGIGAGAGNAIVQPVVTPGRIIVQEAPAIVPDYVESDPIVIQQEAAPRFVFGDANPVRLNHVSRPVVIENFETPYIIDAVQQSAFINHAAQPVVIDHFEAPEVIRDEGLPVIYEACDCGVSGCDGGCGCASAAIISAPCH